MRIRASHEGTEPSGSPPEQTTQPKRGWKAGHPPKRVESGANCEDQRREANSHEPLVSRDFAPLDRWEVTTEKRGLPGSSRRQEILLADVDCLACARNAPLVLNDVALDLVRAEEARRLGVGSTALADLAAERAGFLRSA